MSHFVKISVLLAVFVAAAYAARSGTMPTNPTVELIAHRAFFDTSNGAPPYSHCGSKMSKGKVTVRNYQKDSQLNGVSYIMQVDLTEPKSGSSPARTYRGKTFEVFQAKGGKLTVKQNPCD